MNLLDANDEKGRYPQSWYAASLNQHLALGPLWEHKRHQVCIIGAGYSGLSTAYHLAKKGVDCCIIEAQKPGWGASGRNGGQLGSGQRMEQLDLEALVGREKAHKFWKLGEASKDLVKGLINEHGIDCELKPGVILANHRKRYNKHMRKEVRLLNEEYGYDAISYLDQAAIRNQIDSPAYYGGSLDMGAAHLHPLNYALGLAAEAMKLGVEIYELTRVQSIERGSPAKVITDRGVVVADHVVVACNGYLGDLEPEVATRAMPINNFIIATKKLGPELAKSLIPNDVAAADSKFVVNYFRLSDDNRLIFGGGENYGYRFPKNIKDFVRKPMEQIFPQLKGVYIEYGWGGTLAITRNRMPHYVHLDKNIHSIAGYSGHGVGTATLSGKLMADCITGDAEGFDLYKSLDIKKFPGGTRMRWPLLVVGMLYHAMLDRL